MYKGNVDSIVRRNKISKGIRTIGKSVLREILRSFIVQHGNCPLFCVIPSWHLERPISTASSFPTNSRASIFESEKSGQLSAFTVRNSPTRSFNPSRHIRIAIIENHFELSLPPPLPHNPRKIPSRLEKSYHRFWFSEKQNERKIKTHLPWEITQSGHSMYVFPSIERINSNREFLLPTSLSIKWRKRRPSKKDAGKVLV